MTLIRRSNLPSLFNEGWLTDFFDTERLFDGDWLKRAQVVPAVNITEKEKEFQIEMAAPGMDKKDFNITIDNGVMTISSEKEREEEEKDTNYTRQEYSYSSFSRSFTLPDNVKTDTVNAQYQNGILKISLPKVVETKVKPKAIEVR